MTFYFSFFDPLGYTLLPCLLLRLPLPLPFYPDPSSWPCSRVISSLCLLPGFQFAFYQSYLYEHFIGCLLAQKVVQGLRVNCDEAGGRSEPKAKPLCASHCEPSHAIIITIIIIIIVSVLTIIVIIINDNSPWLSSELTVQHHQVVIMAS